MRYLVNVVDGAEADDFDVARSFGHPHFRDFTDLLVQKATADELIFTVNRAVTLAGCNDSTYTFKKVDDKTLKGELAEGRAASLTRK